MNTSGFGARGAKSLSSTSNGKRNVVDVGPDRIILYVGGSDITLWLDSTDPRLSLFASGAAVPTWYDKSVNQAHMVQTDVGREPTYSHNAPNLNGRPCINSAPASFQDYTGSAVSWSSDCYTMMLAKRGAGTTGYFFSQEADPFTSGDLPNLSFLIRSDGDGTGARLVQSAIGFNAGALEVPPSANVQLQIKTFNYFTNASYSPPHITNLEAATNSNKFGLVHMTWEIQATSSATRGAPYDCSTGCTGTAAIPISCYNKDFTVSSPGALYGPGATRSPAGPGWPRPGTPAYSIQADKTKPDQWNVPALEVTGWGDLSSDEPPHMFVSKNDVWAAWDTAFFLGLKRVPSEGELRRLSKAVLHKFGSNCYNSGYTTATDTDTYSDIL